MHVAVAGNTGEGCRDGGVKLAVDNMLLGIQVMTVAIVCYFKTLLLC